MFSITKKWGEAASLKKKEKRIPFQLEVIGLFNILERNQQTMAKRSNTRPLPVPATSFAGTQPCPFVYLLSIAVLIRVAGLSSCKD